MNIHRSTPHENVFRRKLGAGTSWARVEGARVAFIQTPRHQREAGAP